jgi:hypothetical protein
LRLLVDSRQGLIQGELVDLEGQVLARFAAADGLGRALETALARQTGSDLA